LLRRLQGYGRRGRYGTTIFDHTLGMLAMSALRAGPPASTVRTLLAARGSGGWNFNMTARGGRRDDVTSTAMAILAARAAGVSARNRTLRAGLAWLRSQRAPTGGFAEGRRDRTEANPTALAIQAQRAMGIRDGRAIRALRTLQQGAGPGVAGERPPARRSADGRLRRPGICAPDQTSAQPPASLGSRSAYEDRRSEGNGRGRAARGDGARCRQAPRRQGPSDRGGVG